LLGRRAVDEADELLVRFIPQLQRGHRLDADDSARAEVDALGLVAEQHRQRPGDDNEDLLLDVVPVPAACRVGRIAPHPSPGLLEAERGREVGRAARFLTRLRLPLLVLEVVRVRPAVPHLRIVAR